MGLGLGISNIKQYIKKYTEESLNVAQVYLKKAQ